MHYYFQEPDALLCHRSLGVRCQPCPGSACPYCWWTVSRCCSHWPSPATPPARPALYPRTTWTPPAVMRWWTPPPRLWARCTLCCEYTRHQPPNHRCVISHPCFHLYFNSSLIIIITNATLSVVRFFYSFSFKKPEDEMKTAFKDELTPKLISPFLTRLEADLKGKEWFVSGKVRTLHSTRVPSRLPPHHYQCAAAFPSSSQTTRALFCFEFMTSCSEKN